MDITKEEKEKIEKIEVRIYCNFLYGIKTQNKAELFNKLYDNKKVAEQFNDNKKVYDETKIKKIKTIRNYYHPDQCKKNLSEDLCKKLFIFYSDPTSLSSLFDDPLNYDDLIDRLISYLLQSIKDNSEVYKKEYYRLDEDDLKKFKSKKEEILKNWDTIEKARKEAEEIARKEAEEIARQKLEAEEIARKEAEEIARKEAEEIARQKLEAEEIARQKLDAEEIARKEAEEKAKKKAEEKAKKKAEEIARQKLEAEEKAQERLEQDIKNTASIIKEKIKELDKNIKKLNKLTLPKNTISKIKKMIIGDDYDSIMTVKENIGRLNDNIKENKILLLNMIKQKKHDGRLLITDEEANAIFEGLMETTDKDKQTSNKKGGRTRRKKLKKCQLFINEQKKKNKTNKK